MKPTRRLLLFMAAALLSYGVWRLVPRSTATPTIELRFWNGFTGPDGRTMLKIIREFNRQHPGIHVTMQRMDWGTYYNKLFVASLGGRAPEIFVVHASSLPRFARAGLLSPIEADAQGLIPVSDFDPNVWRAMHYHGTPYAIPLDIHPLGMYYNKTLLQAAGLAPPTDRESFLTALRQLKQTRPDDTQQWGFVFASYRNNLLALMAQFGGTLMSEDGTRCLLDAPANVAALEFCTSLIREGLVPRPENFDAWIGFRQGKVALAFEGIYLLSDLEKQPELHYGGAPLPILGIQPATWADSHGLCLRNGLSGPQRDAAWRFLQFLSDHSLQWAEAGQIPVRLSLRDTPAFAAMPVQSAFAKEIPYAHYSPAVPIIFEFFTEFDLAIERAMRGSLTPKEALSRATVRINQAIVRDQRANSVAP